MPIANLQIQFSVEDGQGGRDADSTRARWSTGDANSLGVKREKISLTGSAFTALTVPTGAKSVEIRVGSAISLTLKGVTGDTGITIAPASNPISAPVFLPLGASPSVGILNGSASAQTIETIWTL